MDNRDKILLKYTISVIAELILEYLTYVSWDLIDVLNIKSFDVCPSVIYCDKCNKDFASNEKWYESKDRNLYFCIDCWEKFDPKYNPIFKPEFIKDNDTEYCHSCHKLIQGHETEPIGTFNSLDVCVDCYPKSKNDFILFDGAIENCIWVLSEGFFPVRCYIYPIFNRNIPYQFEGESTKDRMNLWVDSIKKITCIDEDFGPIKQWAIITDEYTVPKEVYDEDTLNARVCLLVDCSHESNGRIAIMNATITQDCCKILFNKINIIIVFDNIDEYLREYNEWKKKYTSGEKYKDEELICTEFSGFIYNFKL